MNEAQFNAMPDNDRFNRVLEGVAYYASVHSPNLSAQKKFGSLPMFMVTLGLDAENEAKAKEYGLKISPATDAIPHPHVKIKRKVKDGVEPSAVKPLVVDSLQNEIPSSVLIGNGSKVACKFATYWPPNGEMYGAGTTFFKMQVKELSVYDPDREADSDLSMDESGFSIADHLSIQNENTPSNDTASEEVATAKSTKKVASSKDIFDE